MLWCPTGALSSSALKEEPSCCSPKGSPQPKRFVQTCPRLRMQDKVSVAALQASIRSYRVLASDRYGGWEQRQSSSVGTRWALSLCI